MVLLFQIAIKPHLNAFRMVYREVEIRPFSTPPFLSPDWSFVSCRKIVIKKWTPLKPWSHPPWWWSFFSPCLKDWTQNLSHRMVVVHFSVVFTWRASGSLPSPFTILMNKWLTRTAPSLYRGTERDTHTRGHRTCKIANLCVREIQLHRKMVRSPSLLLPPLRKQFTWNGHVVMMVMVWWWTNDGCQSVSGSAWFPAVNRIR